MLCSQALLLVFTAQWLITQYTSEQEQLKQNLTKLFTDVQQRISDSLVLTNVIDPSLAGRPLQIAMLPTPTDSTRLVTLSPQGRHRIIATSGTISPADEKKLFRLDTIAFNELFASQMRQNGWDFQSQWINSSDSDTRGRKSIFIQSGFFTTENGVVIDHFLGYLLRRLLPQFGFAFILLSITGAAFYTMFRSLKAQIKLGELKDDFISNMSHELKTPIATVKVALEALGNFNVIDDAVRTREYLAMVTAEMDRLELLATRVLNTSLMETGRIYLQPESYDLQQLVQEVMHTMQLRMQQHSAKISFQATGSSFVIPIDKLHTQGVLINLIDNSLKYGRSPVHISICLTEAAGAVQLSLTDNGPGIPEEYREKVFEKFFRVPTGNMHNTTGYGLGLSYAAQVMRQHNGTINVDNGANGGCVFTLTF